MLPEGVRRAATRVPAPTRCTRQHTQEGELHAPACATRARQGSHALARLPRTRHVSVTSPLTVQSVPSQYHIIRPVGIPNSSTGLVFQDFASIWEKSPVILARRMDKGSNRCTEVRKASTGVLGGFIMVPEGSGAVQERRKIFWDIYRSLSRVVQPVQDVQREIQRKETKSILRNCTAKGAMMLKRVSFALDLTSGSGLSSCAYKGGEMEPRQLAKSYGGTGPEAVKMDNLKTSDYPPVGWRGRLLSPTHLDESKSSSQAQARLRLT
ncbi:hypothetical protein Acr_28g0001410 [Actinidia rufa]|uniref:Uncharacterized protein n=1 Tax=Actinidia rufa TaxID=165716 RepID=A0A7J0H8N5_9ERIC|nr:hypothetical protein Acr_28g0001410 [Actinidia rufa]